MSEPAKTNATSSEAPVGPDPSRAADASDDFARRAAEAPPGLLAEFIDFVRHSKKWWLTSIIVVLLLLGGLLMLGQAVPMIDTIW